MKGLLLKEFYMIKKYCGTYLICSLMFTAMSFFNDSIIFLLYPCLLSGIIPMTIQSLDEKDNWCGYSQTLPYTIAQLVSVKYITGIILSAVCTAAVTAVRFVKNIEASVISAEGQMIFIFISAIVSLISPAVIMPFIFKLGVEKGRAAYLVSVAIIGSIYSLLASVGDGSISTENDLNIFIALICISAAAVYFISWRLSVKFYAEKDF